LIQHWQTEVPPWLVLLAQVPEGVTDEECILLGDILSTAFFCSDQASISTFSLVYIVALDAVAAQVLRAFQMRSASCFGCTTLAV
jgi:predicted HAD superfamily phosphohydrolase YqeG